MKITSAGIIRNEDKPRVGVISGLSLAEWVWDEIDHNGIDLDFEEFILDLKESGVEEDSQEWQDAIDSFDSGRTCILFGDWKKDSDGKYIPDTSGEFAGSYNSDTGIVCIEWSKHTIKTHHTSPCYVMSDGSGPCGDLDTPGDSVIAYTIPNLFRTKEEE